MPNTKPYFGWYIVLASLLILTLVLGSTYSIFGLLVLPVSKEFGLSRADINTALILLNIGVAIIAPLIGRILDRAPARWVMIASAVLFGGSLCALGQSRSLLLSAVIIVLPLSAGVIGAGTLTVTVLIARWFLVHRGRAMTLAMIGTSVGGMTIAPVMAWLIEREGWRTALTGLGIMLMLILMALSLTIRDRPRPDELETPAASAGQPGQARPIDAHEEPLSVPMVLKSRAFWMIGVSAALGMAAPTAIAISLVPLVLERGFSMLDGGTLIAVSAGSAIGGKLLFAFLADRIDRTLLLSLLILLVAIPAAGYALGDGFPLLIGLTMVLGFTTGAIAPLFYALIADRFGVKTFGTVRGLMAPVTALFSAIGVRFIGEMHDLTGDYRLGMQLLVAFAVIAAVGMLASRKVPARLLPSTNMDNRVAGAG
jgi:sugar phosphate permease